MPYKSWNQAAFLHIHHPEIAAKWDAEFGTAPTKAEGKVKLSGPRKPVKRRTPKLR